MKDRLNRSRLAVLVGAVCLTLIGLGTTEAQRGGGKGAKADSEEQEAPQIKISDIAKAKADREENIKDAELLAKLAKEVTEELKSASQFTISVGSVKKADEMERVSKRLHARMKADNVPLPDAPDLLAPQKGGR